MQHATMNRIYRLVWNTALGVWVAVAENAKGKSKGGSARRAVLALASLLAFAHSPGHAADAANAAISAGTGSVATSGAITTVNQTSKRLAIDWSRLSTAASESLVFKQPDASSIALNRITGSDASQLLGSLNANGQVFILNPNGVLFGATSQVNVGGLVASTLSLNNDDFMAGKYSFANAGASGTVVNQGSITSAEGGYVLLLAPEVRNEGVITARLGSALLAAGNKVTLNLDKGSLVSWSIDQGAVNALAENKQLIKADGGQVILSAKALDALTKAAVNNTGFIEAQTVENKAGRILLLGDMNHGSVHVSGTLDASAPAGGDGGLIETSAAGVRIDESAKVSTLARSGRTGSFLIDPDTWTINNGGPTTVGVNNITSNTALNNQLKTTNVTIQTASGTGLITVNGGITWTAGTNLFLNAGGTGGNININAPISFSGGGLDLTASGSISAAAAISGKTLTLESGNWQQLAATLPTLAVNDLRIAGGTFLRALGGDGSGATPYQLTDIYGVQGMASASLLGKSFKLANDIDASGTKNWNQTAAYPTTWGLQPIGNATLAFTGSFNGAGHVISGLTIERPVEMDVGLFGVTNGGNAISNVGLTGVAIHGFKNVGGLVGNNRSIISSSYVTGSVSEGQLLKTGYYSGDGSTGGLVGANGSGGSISNSFSSASVVGSSAVGGLVGFDLGDGVSNSYATGTVTAYAKYAGGLIGYAGGTAVKASYATGNVTTKYAGTGTDYTGGLIGTNSSSVSGSYSTGSVNSTYKVGGLVGENTGSIANSYSTSAVTGSQEVGGLAGRNSGSLLNSYAAGKTVATSFAGGGLIGYNLSAGVTGLVWNTETSAQGVGIGAATGQGLNVAPSQVQGKTSLQMTQASTFTSAGWALDAAGGTDKTWRIYEGHTAPLLRSFLAFKDIGATATYDGTTHSVPAPQPDPQILGTGPAAGISAKDAGTLRNGDYYSGQQGWDILDTLTIKPVVLTISGVHAYDGTAYLASNELVLNGLVAGESIQLVNPYGGPVAFLFNPATGSFAGNVGSNTFFFSSNTVVSAGAGTSPGNYIIPGNYSSLINIAITPRVLTVSGSRAYDGTTLFNAGNLTLQSLVTGQSLTLAGSGVVADKNVGAGKALMTTGLSLGNGVGGLASNYTLAGGTPLVDIMARELTITATGQTKVYDGGTSATVTLDSNKLAGDVLTLIGSASFADKNVGIAKTISVGGISLTGADAGNYSFNTVASASADITARALTVTATGMNKVYDGSTAAIVTFASDKVTGDMLNLAGTASFADKNVGTAKTVSVGGINVTGIDAGNYRFNTVASTSADITARALTVTATGQNKVYDGGRLATVTLASDKVTGDMLNLAGTASFADKNVGTAKTISVGGINVNGIDAGNYRFNTVASTSADITARALTVTASGKNKVYDGNTSATVTLASDKVVGDMLNLAGTASFADKNVGIAKTITVGGISLTGADAGNYSFNMVASASADITARALTVTATGKNKVYDGGTFANVTLASDQVTGDMLNLGGNANFADKNVGIAKTINVGGITLTGADAGNYSFNTVASASAEITARALTVTATGKNKVYDGNTSATVTLGSDKIAGDVLNLAGNASFADKNVGIAKTITVGGIALTGADAGNYSFNTIASASANITARALTVTATGKNKVYDGNTSVTVTLASDKVTGDMLNLAGNASFADKNVGTAKTITVGGINVTGIDAGNYSFNTVASASADITARALTITATGKNKVYDGNTSATVALASDKIAGDMLNLAGNASFADKNVGTAKTITASGITVTGIDAGNYSFNTVASASADITARALTITATGNNKVYDGNTSANVTLGSDKVARDVLNLGGSASFADKNVGTAKTVNVGGITVTGTDAGNYSFNNVAFTSADITARALTITATGQNKVYDGNTSATVTLGSDKLAGDMLNLGGNARFADKNVGTAKTITVGGITVSGTDASNYSINTVASASADITARSLTITATGQNKIYDGNTSATVTLASDKVAGDVLDLGGSASFADKNVGTAKSVTVGGINVTGIDAGNYSFNTATSTSADITARALTITATGQNKVYDGNTSATVTLGSTNVAGDVLNITSNASFSDKNVGTAKTISVGSILLTGADAGNYSFNTSASASADITARALTVTATGQNKVYDGNTSATVTLASDKVTGDVLNLAGTASFADKNVGTAKTITVGGINVTGIDAGNYSFNTATSTSADITARALTITANGQNKVYSGNTSATVTLASDKVTGDVLNLAGNASFADKNVGTAKTISVGGITVSGTDAVNYNFNTIASASANITARALTITATGQNKVYDGNTSATVTLASDKVAGDMLNLAGTTSFADKNVGTAKTVTASGISVTGPDASNYSFNTVASTGADITTRPLTVTPTGQNKVYDGGTSASVTLASDKIAGDELTLASGSAIFNSRNAASMVGIKVIGITAGGTDAGNYALVSNTAVTSAAIAPKALSVSANNDTRPFSNLLYSGGNGVVYSGFVAGDGVSDLLGKLVYAGSSQGARLPGNYVIAPGGLSSLSGNYAPGYVSGTLVILPSPLFGPLMVTNPSMVTSLLSQSGVTSAALWGFGGIPTLINVSDCALQAVTGLDGAQGKSGAGCTPTHSIEAMGKVLDATAAEDGQ